MSLLERGHIQEWTEIKILDGGLWSALVLSSEAIEDVDMSIGDLTKRGGGTRLHHRGKRVPLSRLDVQDLDLIGRLEPSRGSRSGLGASTCHQDEIVLDQGDRSVESRQLEPSKLSAVQLSVYSESGGNGPFLGQTTYDVDGAVLSLAGLEVARQVDL